MELTRIECEKDYTLGVMSVKDEFFWILENPWLENKSNISCIPKGEYDLDYLPRSAPGKYRRVYWLRGVPNRSAILIHTGNITQHTRGCLLIGMKPGWIKGQRAVFQSRTALGKLREVLGYENLPKIRIGQSGLSLARD